MYNLKVEYKLSLIDVCFSGVKLVDWFVFYFGVVFFRFGMLEWYF